MDSIAAGPPSQPWTLPGEVTAELNRWLSLLLYGGLFLSILATMAFAALIALDHKRGEAVDSTSHHVRALRIALGVAVMCSAASIAQIVFY